MILVIIPFYIDIEVRLVQIINMKKRYQNISLYRLIAALCILYFHAAYLLLPRMVPYETLLSKGVQGLTVLSGFLYSQKVIKSKKDFYYKNILKLLIPCILTIIIVAISLVGVMIINKNYNYLSLWFSQRPYTGKTIFLFGNFWYLPYILVCYLITPLLQKAKGSNNIVYKLLILFVVILETLISFFFKCTNVIFAFVIGYIVGSKKFNEYVDESNINPNKVSILTILLVICLFMYSFTYFNKIDNYFLSSLNTLMITFSSSFIGVISFFLFIYLFKWLNKYQKKLKILSISDKCSYALYLMNQVFLVGGTNIALLFNNSYLLQVVVVYTATIISSIVITKLSDLAFMLFFRQKSKNVVAS